MTARVTNRWHQLRPTNTSVYNNGQTTNRHVTTTSLFIASTILMYNQIGIVNSSFNFHQCPDSTRRRISSSSKCHLIEYWRAVTTMRHSPLITVASAGARMIDQQRGPGGLRWRRHEVITGAMTRCRQMPRKRWRSVVVFRRHTIASKQPNDDCRTTLTRSVFNSWPSYGSWTIKRSCNAASACAY